MKKHFKTFSNKYIGAGLQEQTIETKRGNINIVTSNPDDEALIESFVNACKSVDYDVLKGALDNLYNPKLTKKR
jgi:hypothetical protein